MPGAILWSLLALVGPSFVMQPLMPAVLYLLPFSQNVQVSLVSILLQALGFFIIVALVKTYGRNLGDIGFGRFLPIYAGKAILGYGMYFMLTVVLHAASLALPINQDQPQQLGFQALAGIEVVLAFIVLTVCVPVVEETIFRGFMFRGLRRRLSFWPTALVVSLIFGLVHGQWNVGIDVFALSIVACYLREESASLWPAIILHAVKNSVAFLHLYFYNGL